jgi:hypothetical protein
MRKYFHALQAIMLAAVLTGCGSSQAIVKHMDRASATPTKFHLDPIEDHSGKAVPTHFLAAVRGYLESDLTQRSLLAADGDTAAHVRIDVTNYRMRSGFNRAIFGVMAGKDGIESKVTVLDPGAKETVGETNVSTFNVAAIGGEEDIARMHANEITRFLTGDSDKGQK